MAARGRDQFLCRLRSMVDTWIISAASVLSHFWFPIDNLGRDASISFNIYRRVKHHQIQVKFEKGSNPKIMFFWDLDFG